MYKKNILITCVLLAVATALCACDKKTVEVNPTTPTSLVTETTIPEETIADPIVDTVPSSIDEDVLNGLKPSDDVKLETGKFVMTDGVELNWAEAMSDENKEKYMLNFEFQNGTALVNSLNRNYYIESVVIPEGISELNGSLCDCQYMKTVVIPDSVEYISSSIENAPLCSIELAANSKKKLEDGVLYSEDGKTLISYLFTNKNTTFTVPEGVEVIARNAIVNNSYLEELTLANTVKTLEYNSISNLSKLKTISLNDGLETIDYSLVNLTALETLRIPDSAILSNNSLSGCINLNSFIINDENENYCIVDGVLYSKDMKTMIFYPSGKADEVFEIPETVEYCEYDAMRYNQNITELTLSPAMKDVTMFINSCHALKKVNIPATVERLDDLVFFNLDSLVEIHFMGTEENWNNIEKSPSWIVSQIEYNVTFEQ